MEETNKIFERARAAYGSGAYDDATLEFLFPQLKESEDERIRKALIEVFKEKLERGFEWVEYGIPNRSVLDWLEKQKEQKDYKKLYEDIAKSEWFKKAYEGKSLGCDYEHSIEECEYDNETITQKAYREGQNAGRQEVFDNPWAYGLEKIDNVFGFRIGDKVKLVDGDGRPHIIKLFEKIAGLHGPDFYRAVFEDNTASDHIIPGDEYPNGYFTRMEKIDEQKEQKPVEIHIDNPNIQKFDTDVKVTTSDSSAGGKELLYVSNKSYDIGFRDGVASVKPAEWSEADDAIHTRVLGALGKAFMGALPTNPSQEDIEWFKSLPERFNLQPKQEWSDEEKKVLDSIIDDYEKAAKSFCGYDGKIMLLKAIRDGEYDLSKQGWGDEDEETIDEAVEYIERYAEYVQGGFSKQHVLDLARRVDSLRPEFHWKPSEEQMTALKKGAGYLAEYGTSDDDLVLDTLYDDLKKL